MGVPAERVRGHERCPALGVREEPVHAPLRRIRALRPRDAALRDALHALATWGSTAEQSARITSKEYEAGHMMYLHVGELAKLRKDVAAFFASALGK